MIIFWSFWISVRSPQRLEGGLTVVLRLLIRRLDAIEPQLRSRLQQLSSTQLEELALALLDFTTKADLVSWLQTH